MRGRLVSCRGRCVPDHRCRRCGKDAPVRHVVAKGRANHPPLRAGSHVDHSAVFRTLRRPIHRPGRRRPRSWKDSEPRKLREFGDVCAVVSQYRIAVCSRWNRIDNMCRICQPRGGIHERRGPVEGINLQPIASNFGIASAFRTVPETFQPSSARLAARGVAPSIQGQSRINADASC